MERADDRRVPAVGVDPEDEAVGLDEAELPRVPVVGAARQLERAPIEVGHGDTEQDVARPPARAVVQTQLYRRQRALDRNARQEPEGLGRAPGESVGGRHADLDPPVEEAALWRFLPRHAAGIDRREQPVERSSRCSTDDLDASRIVAGRSPAGEVVQEPGLVGTQADRAAHHEVARIVAARHRLGRHEAERDGERVDHGMPRILRVGK